MSENETPGERLHRCVDAEWDTGPWSALDRDRRDSVERIAAAFLGPENVAVRADDLKTVLDGVELGAHPDADEAFCRIMDALYPADVMAAVRAVRRKLRVFDGGRGR